MFGEKMLHNNVALLKEKKKNLCKYDFAGVFVHLLFMKKYTNEKKLCFFFTIYILCPIKKIVIVKP